MSVSEPVVEEVAVCEPEMEAATNKTDGKISSLLQQGLETYSSAKNAVLENKRLGETVNVAPAVTFFEETVVKAAELSPVKLDRSTVETLDSNVDSAIKYGEETKEAVKAKVNSTKEIVVDTVYSTKDAVVERVNCTKDTVVETVTSTKDTVVGKVNTTKETVVDTVNSTKEALASQVACTKETVVGKVTSTKEAAVDTANQLLDVSESYVDHYLEELKEEEEEAKPVSSDLEQERKETKAVGIRIFELSKTVSKRMQKRAFAGMDSLKLRTEQVVHLDLMQYSEMLDSAKGDVLETYNTKIMLPAREKTIQAKKAAVEAKDVFVTKASDAKELIVDSADEVLVKVAAVRVPFTENDVMFYWTIAAEEADSRIIKPFGGLVESLQKEFAAEVDLLQSQEKDVANAKELTLEAGLKALVAVLRRRTSVIFESMRRSESTVPESVVSDAKEDEVPVAPVLEKGGLELESAILTANSIVADQPEPEME